MAAGRRPGGRQTPGQVGEGRERTCVRRRGDIGSNSAHTKQRPLRDGRQHRHTTNAPAHRRGHAPGWTRRSASGRSCGPVSSRAAGQPDGRGHVASQSRSVKRPCAAHAPLGRRVTCLHTCCAAPGTAARLRPRPCTHLGILAAGAGLQPAPQDAAPHLNVGLRAETGRRGRGHRMRVKAASRG